MDEAQYKDIFKDPETIKNLKSKSVSSRERMLGSERLMQILQRSKELIDQLEQDEAPYKGTLEKLAVDMIKKMYPVIDEFDIEIEATLGNDQLSPSDKKEEKDEDEEEDEESSDLPSLDIMNDEIAKRRLINAITQGASIRGALDKPFMDLLDQVPDSLLDSYNETLSSIDSIEKYGETLKKVFGIFHDEEALAMFLAMLAGGGGGGGSKGGESEAEYDAEEGKLKIRATGLIFPFLIHEIIKGLYEIVSLQGFTKSKETNQATVAAADKLEYEPEDFAFGTHIQEALEKLYKEANVRNKISFELFLANLYREDDASTFVAFIENLINDKLSSNQKRWALDYMEPTSEQDDDEEDIDNIDLSGLGLEENIDEYVEEDDIDEYDVESEQDIKEFIQFMREYKQPLQEAEYHGRKVQLGKPMQGDIKKFKVYVKNPKGKVVKVNFGFGGKSAHGKRMVIKKNNPVHRKAYRARHHCDNPGPRWKANYWSCRKW